MKKQIISFTKTAATMLALALAMLLSISTSAQAQDNRALTRQDEATPTAKCPDGAKCGFFVGTDLFRTDVQVSDGAFRNFRAYGIVLRNENTKLIWLTDACRHDESLCANIDLTGRHPKRFVPFANLNRWVRISAEGQDTVKFTFEEQDGDSDTIRMTEGVWPKPSVKR